MARSRKGIETHRGVTTRELVENDASIEYESPLFANLVAQWFGGFPNVREAAQFEGVTVEDYMSNYLTDGLDMDLLEKTAEAHYDRLMQGVPFPGENPEWDAKVAADPGLQEVQKFFNLND